jgi:hypothetical protein
VRFIAYGVTPSAGANTVTVTTSANGYISFGIDEFTGQHASPFSVNGGSSTGTSTAPSDGITTLTANELIIGCLGVDIGSGVVTITSGQTEIGQEGNGNNFETYGASFQIAGAAGAYNQTWTLGTSQTWRVLTASFKEATGGADQTLIDSLFTNTNTFFADAIVLSGGDTDAFQADAFQFDAFQMDATGDFTSSFNESAATSDSQTATVSASVSRTETVATSDSQTTANGGIMVQWEPSADPNVTGYFVYWDTVSHAGGVYTDYPNSVDVLGNDASQVLITSLVVGQTYFINISSHGAGGHDANESALWGEITDTASDLGLWQFLIDGLRFENQNTFFSDTIILGGGAVSASFVDSAATGDSQTAALSANRSVTESAATADSQTAGLSASRSVTESAATSDAQTSAVSSALTVTETAATSDSQGAALSATVTGAETVAHADNQTAALTASATATDSTATADTSAASLGGGNFIASFGDSAATADSQNAGLTASASATESTATGDSPTAIASASATAIDTTATSDTSASSLGGGTFIVSFGDSAGTAENQTAGLTASASASETTATSDSITGGNGLSANRTEAAIVSDSATGGLTAIVTFGDNVTVLDSQSASMAAIVAASDIVVSGDSLSGVNSRFAQFTDSAVTGDTIGASLSTQIIPTLDWSRYHIKVKAKAYRIRIHL